MKKLAYLGVLLLLLLMQACIGDINEADTTSKPPTSTEVFIEPDDKEFANKVAIISLDEIELGKLAIQKGNDKRIKNFGTLLVKQHTKTHRKLKLIALAKKLTLPAAPDTITQKEITSLSQLSGKAFDKAFLDHATADQERNLQLFEAAAKHVYDKDLRKIANRDILVIKRHIYALNGIRAMIER